MPRINTGRIYHLEEQSHSDFESQTFGHCPCAHASPARKAIVDLMFQSIAQKQRRLTISRVHFTLICTQYTPNDRVCGNSTSSNNKFAQSNLGRGPRRGTVAHIRRKVPIGYNGVPQIRPKSTPSRGPIPKHHYLPHP